MAKCLTGLHHRSPDSLNSVQNINETLEPASDLILKGADTCTSVDILKTSLIMLVLDQCLVTRRPGNTRRTMRQEKVNLSTCANAVDTFPRNKVLISYTFT